MLLAWVRNLSKIDLLDLVGGIHFSGVSCFAAWAVGPINGPHVIYGPWAAAASTDTQGVSASDVAVKLSAGSVVVEATITLADGASAESIRSAVSVWHSCGNRQS